MKTPIKALIVDDEAPARKVVEAYLSKHSDIEIIGECSNGFEALKVIREQAVDLLFLDIQMPKVTGLELMEVLEEPVQVIFTTAYDEYALKAFDLNAVDYLLKPFNEKRFAEAVQKAIQRMQLGQNDDKEKALAVRETIGDKLERIVVKQGSKLQVLSLDEVVYLEAQDDYVMINARQGRFLKQSTMSYFESHLPESQFLRIHRSTIANVNFITKLESYTKDDYVAVLQDGNKLKVSRSGYKRLKEVLGI